MNIGNPIFDLVNYIMYSITDCHKCHKAKRTFLTFLMIVGGALGVGLFTGIIFIMGAQFIGIEKYRIEIMLRLPMLAGAATYIWWILWQYDKLFCECE